jgi:hypothetical protein
MLSFGYSGWYASDANESELIANTIIGETEDCFQLPSSIVSPLKS